MYRGLKELMGSKAEWKVERLGNANLPDPLFDYEAFFAKEKELRNDKKNKVRPNSSLSRVALQIKFDVALVQVSKDKETVLSKTQLLWSYRPTSIGLSMVADMRRLLERGAVGCTEVSRRLVSKKGGVQNVSLLDTGSLEATYSTDAGSLVPAASKLRSLRADIKARVKDLAEGGYLTPSQRDEVRASWDKFEEDYIKAMQDFVSTGLHGDAVMRQADSFGALSVEHLTGHRQPAGHRGTDDLRQPGGHPAAGQDAHPRVGVGEDRSLRGDQEVACQRNLQTAGERRPVDRTDDRGAQSGDGRHAVVPGEPPEVLPAELLGLLEVDAGAERRIGSGEHHRVHGLVGIGGEQRGVQRLEELRAQRISRLRAVHGEQPNRAMVLAQQHGGRGHRIAKEVAASTRSSTGCGNMPTTRVTASGTATAMTVRPLGGRNSGASAGESVKNISTMTRA